MENVGVIDLFCGIGGLSHGFVQEGFKILGGYDFDSTCKYAFTTNNDAPFYSKDVAKVTGKELNLLFGDNLKVLVGCAPCQPFSPYSNSLKEKDKSKWSLIEEFARLVRETKPEVISMENVPQLQMFQEADILGRFLRILRRNGYRPIVYNVFCPDYGIPQSRRRLVLLAAKKPIKLVEATHGNGKLPYATVSETIRHLPELAAGGIDPLDPLHRSRALTEINRKRMAATKEGGSWKDWPQELVLACHRKESGKSYGSVYGRMRWDDLAPTITTHCTGIGNGRFGHPTQDRAISFREAALLQTFPSDYDFIDKTLDFNASSVSRQIGNAVPPLLGQVIAKSIKLYLQENQKH